MHKHRRHDFSTEKRTGVDAKGSGSSLIPYTCTLQRCSVPLRVQLGIHVFEKCADHRQCDSDTCMISSPHMHVDFAAVSPGAYFDKSHKRFAPLYPSPTWWMTLRPLTCRIADKDSDCGDVERDGGKSVDEQPSPSNDQALSSNPTPTSSPYHDTVCCIPLGPFVAAIEFSESELLLSAASLTLEAKQHVTPPDLALQRCTMCLPACSTVFDVKLAAPSARLHSLSSPLACLQTKLRPYSSLFPTLRGPCH